MTTASYLDETPRERSDRVRWQRAGDRVIRELEIRLLWRSLDQQALRRGRLGPFT